MTTPFLTADLRVDEGLAKAIPGRPGFVEAYPDPLTGAEPWTIGYGHTGKEVHLGLVWSEAEAANALANDVGAVIRSLDRSLPWWRSLSDIRQDVLANMGFNLGVQGLLAFHHALAAIQAGDWQAAHDGMLDSAWAHQVGDRAQRLATQMLTGAHA